MKKVAVIGGGFLGSELAVALGNRANGKDLEIIQIYKEKGNMAKVTRMPLAWNRGFFYSALKFKVLPDYLSAWTTDKVRKEGVTVKANTSIRDAIITPDSKLLLITDDGEEIKVDHAVVAVGMEPNTELAKTSKLELDDRQGGFRVNAELEARYEITISRLISH